MWIATVLSNVNKMARLLSSRTVCRHCCWPELVALLPIFQAEAAVKISVFFYSRGHVSLCSSKIHRLALTRNCL